MEKEPITVTVLEKLKYLENLWIENNFNISEKEVENTFLN